MGVSNNRGGPPNHPILIGFSIIFTIHFGGFPPNFWRHPYRHVHSFSIWQCGQAKFPGMAAQAMMQYLHLRWLRSLIVNSQKQHPKSKLLERLIVTKEGFFNQKLLDPIVDALKKNSHEQNSITPGGFLLTR